MQFLGTVILMVLALLISDLTGHLIKQLSILTAHVNWEPLLCQELMLVHRKENNHKIGIKTVQKQTAM